MDIQFPPFLQKGDKVVIVSPSSKIDKQFLKGAKKRIESWGVKVVMGKHAGGSSGRYAGTISQRLKDLQDAMDDPKVKAILSSRGGYGAVHLIDKIDFTAFREYPKWLLGFSDITALHNLFQKNGYASLHSLMARHLAVEPEDDPCTNYLKDILFGNLPSYTCEKHKLNKQGSTQGVLRGGNMAVAYGLRGTPYDIPAEALSDPQFAKMIREAEKYLGYPYVWGGASPSTSFDCSGFVCWVINNCGNGWNVGRTTADGLRSYCSYVSPSDAKPGDLIFFQGTYDTLGASHVGIYVGNNMMIHCGNPIQYTSIASSYWQQHFMAFGRLH